MTIFRHLTRPIGAAAAFSGLLFSLAPLALSAQDFPSRPINFVVPFSAGASTDVMARMVANVVSKDLGQPVIVENRPGAGGNIAADHVAKQPANGYTVFVGSTANLAVNKTLYQKLPYDPAADFTHLTVAWMTRNVLVVAANSPWQSVKDVISAARQNPGQLSYGSPGSGTAGHLIGEVFKDATDTQITHVPYKGQNQVISDIIGGHIALSFDTIGTAVPMIRSGKVRALAITGESRHPMLPDVPTFTESGIKDVDTLRGWAMFAVPAGTPPAIVDRLQGSLAKALLAPEVKSKLEDLGVEVRITSPSDSKKMVQTEIRRWGDIVKAVGVRAD